VYSIPPPILLPAPLPPHTLQNPTQDGATLYALWPDGTCESMGLGGSLNTSLTDMIGAVVNASNTPAVAAAINARLANLSSSIAGGAGGGQDQMTQQVGVGGVLCVCVGGGSFEEGAG
jgi:hypothetical protein